jgi:DNA-binding CsgD family transcriptional regulator
VNPTPHLNLSKREKDIITLITEDLNYKEISKKLFISKRTVEEDIKSLKEKVGCKTVARLIFELIRLKIIHIEINVINHIEESSRAA